MVSVPRGVFGTDQVDVSYEPWRAVRPTPLRLGPSARAPQVRSDDGVPVGLAAGQHLGRQSTRNPGCLDSPPLRGSVDGFVWGYCLPAAVRKSGWMRVADLEPDPAFEGLACGPADADFDRRRPQACGGGHCDGRPLSGLCDASGRAVVEAQDVYLRYAPGSTPFRYLVRGDSVSRLLRSHPSWTAVEIRAGRWAGRRTRGWVLSETLRPARG